MRIFSILLIFISVVFNTGCATNKDLYSWGQYEPQIYEHFKNESPDKQIAILEEHLNKTKLEGKKIPPGYYAHLGLVYERAGRGSEFIAMLEEEKRNFPESTIFVNNLINRFKNGVKN